VSLIELFRDTTERERERRKNKTKQKTMADNNNNNNNNNYDDNDDDDTLVVCKDSDDVQSCLDSSGDDEQQRRRRLNFTLHPQMEELFVVLSKDHKEERIDAFLKALSSNPHLRHITICMDILVVI